MRAVPSGERGRAHSVSRLRADSDELDPLQSDLDLDQILKSSSFKQHATALEEKDHSLNGNQSLFGQLNLTIGKFYRINGSSTQHIGVMPDVAFPVQYPVSKYGEDSEGSALVGDTIGRTDFVKLSSLEQPLTELNRLHQNRFKSSGLDTYSADVLMDLAKFTSPKLTSLNMAENKKESEAKELLLFQRNNRLRKAIGLAALKKGEKVPKSEDLDFIKKEAGQVLTDYILSKPAKPGLQGSK